MAHRTITTAVAGLAVAGLALSIAPRRAVAQQNPPPPPPADQPRMESPRIDQLMSPEERAATGVAALSAAQRGALESWLGRYTAAVAAGAGSARGRPFGPPPEAGGPGARESGPPAAGRRGRRPGPGGDDGRAALPRTIPNGAVVRGVSDGGGFVTLDDGTRWEVYLPDRPATDGWSADDVVLVRRRSAPVGEFDHLLVNGAARDSASVRFAGRAAPKRAEDGKP